MRHKTGEREKKSPQRNSFAARIGECLRLLSEHLAGYVNALKALEKG